MANMLFLCHRIPYPPDKGDKIRAFHFLRHFASRHRVHLGCLVDDPADMAHLPALEALCAEVHAEPVRPLHQKLRALMQLRPGRPLTPGYCHAPALARWVQATLAARDIDRIFVFSSGMAGYVLAASDRRRILDMVDVDSEKWAEYGRVAGWPARLVWAREGRTLLAFERRAARQFDRTLFVSAPERQHFARLAPESADRLEHLENGVDLEWFAPYHHFARPLTAAAPHIVFTGTMDYRPNVDAVTWFARHVLPQLAARRPAPVFVIVGASPTAEVRRLAALPGVVVTGRVADVRPYLAHADVVVAPLRIARGIQNKVLEAMAMGRPVVASPQALTGLRVTAGRDLLVAESAAETAAAVASVLDGHHPDLGAAGRQAVAAGHDWAIALQRLDAILDADAPVGEKLQHGSAGRERDA
jgi:sugar transferase (PEP-CTERM/EpsH1 system associated)